MTSPKIHTGNGGRRLIKIALMMYKLVNGGVQKFKSKHDLSPFCIYCLSCHISDIRSSPSVSHNSVIRFYSYIHSFIQSLISSCRCISALLHARDQTQSPKTFWAPCTVLISFWIKMHLNEHSFVLCLADRTASLSRSMIGYWHDTVACLSVCLFVTLCIVAKWCIVRQKCLNKWIGSVP